MTFTDLSSLTGQTTIGTHLSSASKKSVSTKLAQNVHTGNGDLCFLIDTPVDGVLKTFQEQKVNACQILFLRYEIKSCLGVGARGWSIIFSTRERLVSGD